MGLFDTVRSSMPLLGQELDIEMQTKDLDCVMGHWWISPAGELYEVMTRQAFDGQVVPKGERKWEWQTVRWVRNGQNGVLRPDRRTVLLHLISARWHSATGDWSERPQVCLYVRDGKVVERVLGCSCD